MTKTRSQGNGDNPHGEGNSVNAPQDGGPPPATNLSVVVVDSKMTVQERVNAFLGNFIIENRDSGKILIFQPCNYSKDLFESWLQSQAKQFEGMDREKEYTHAFLKAYVRPVHGIPVGVQGTQPPSQHAVSQAA